MPYCVRIVLNLLDEFLRKVRSVLAYVDRNHVLENGSRYADAVQTPDEASTVSAYVNETRGLEAALV
jgi:hypothetical protein